MQGINLLINLNPSAVRKNIKSQQFEASMSTEREDIDSYIMDSQEQEQNAMDKELQNTIIAGNNLGIKFNESGVLRMKKMIENEHKAMIASLKNNTFAPSYEGPIIFQSSEQNKLEASRKITLWNVRGLASSLK